MPFRNLLRQFLRALPGRFHTVHQPPHVEQLESRDLPSVNPLSPAAVRQAYGFNLTDATGAGQTIGIVDAFDDPNVFNDLDTFDKAFSSTTGEPSLYSQFGPSSSVLTAAMPEGMPSPNIGWSQETSLDVEWAHAIAPAAHILLVEAKSDSLSDLLSAVDYAAQNGAQVVSMSWGTAEFPGETAYDSTFQQPGVTYVDSSGDSAGPDWPAVSPNVVGVGGTTLSVSPSGTYQGETAWSSSGGGISAFEPKPAFQNGVTQSATQRTSPDVAYNANPGTGFWVYDSSSGGWGQFGGTSAGAPQWAALVALADQGRAAPLGSSETLSALYSLSTVPNNFHDVTQGSSGTNAASSGYDLATGLGSPVANNLIAALGGSSASATPTKAVALSQVTATHPPMQPVHRGVTLIGVDFLIATTGSSSALNTSGPASTQPAAQSTAQPVFLTQVLVPPAPYRIIPWLGETLDQPDDVDDGAVPVSYGAASAPAYNLQLSLCYTDPPVVERRTWGEAVGTFCDKAFTESKEMYPARPELYSQKSVPREEQEPLVAGFLMAAATVAVRPPPRYSTSKFWADDAWRYWRRAAARLLRRP